VTLDYLPLRFPFTALDPVRVPPGEAGNLFRGVLGAMLHRIDAGAYAHLFVPSASGGPSGLAERPRPFVLRVRHLDGRTFERGEVLDPVLHLFDIQRQWIDVLTEAFAELGRAGLGPGRGRAALDRVDAPAEPMRMPLAPRTEGIRHARVEFLSPTELKPVNRPEFAVLFARARDRVSALRTFYGSGPLPIDFRAMGGRAAAVETVRCDVQFADTRRRSSRTGQVHGIGGFTGAAEYQGALDEFLPYLAACAATGVGRHTVWGNGELRVNTEPRPEGAVGRLQ
jgi:hypothetical protein